MKQRIGKFKKETARKHHSVWANGNTNSGGKSPFVPLLTKSAYYCTPTIQMLSGMSREQLEKVQDFSIEND